MPDKSSAVKARRPKNAATGPAKSAAGKDKPRCGLCGKRGKLTKTECCGQWICDDEANYVLFSYAHNSCSRNHRRYTLCAYHYNEGHKGDWQSCKKCRKEIETEMYVYYGTNDYNFVKLENPPSYEPTRCTGCNQVIKLGTDGYTVSKEGTYCMSCSPVRGLLGAGR
jgi:hypothetical protein